MDKNLWELLKKRAEVGQCIICGKELNEKVNYATFGHSVLGPVRVEERHIKVQQK